MVEAAHVIIVQISSVLEMLMSLAALYLVARAFSGTKGVDRKAASYLVVFAVVLAVAGVLMATYHVFDIDFALESMHYVLLLALLLGAFVSIYVPIKYKEGV